MLKKIFQIQIRKKRRDDSGDEAPSESPERPESESSDGSTSHTKEDLVAELIWTSGAPVERYDENGAFLEVLGLEDSQVRLDYFNSGNAPVLDSHNGDSVSNILGVVQSATLEGEGADRVGKAIIRLSARDSVKEIYEDIQNGIIRNCSVGYRVYTYEEQQAQEGQLRTLVATDWEPIELSLCPVGADSRAGFRSEEKNSMSVEVKKQSEANAEEIIKKERERITEIRKHIVTANLGDDVAEDLIQRGVNLDESRKFILDRLAEKSKAHSQRSVISAGTQDDQEAAKRGMLDALLTRHDSKRYPMSENGRRFIKLKLVDMARKSLGMQAEGLDNADIITRSMMSSSDFPALLSMFSNRVLRDAYELVV